MGGELESLVVKFAAGHGLPAPTHDDDGRYHFLIDGDLEIAMFQHGSQILLEGKLQPLPAGQVEAGNFLKQTLRRHLGRLRDHQEVLSLDPESKDLVLFRQLSATAVSAADFDRAVGDMANALDFWSTASRTQARPRMAVPRQQVFRP